jgi:hypothetical protein
MHEPRVNKEYRVSKVKARHSGYPKISGRVIRVVRNSGIENCYPIFVPKKHYPKFWVPDNSGSGFTDIPKIDKTNHFRRIQVPF